MELINRSDKLNNDIILKFIIDARYRLYRHLILIMLLAAGFYSSKVVFSEPLNTIAKISFFLTLLFLFYINMYRFVPRLLFKDNYLGYFLWVVGLFVVIQVLSYYVKNFMAGYVKPRYVHDDGEPNLFFLTFVFIILMGASAAIKLFQRWIADTQRINELETITIQSELEHLKKQINPHFLFNTLNNANVLTQKDPYKASQVLMKLSDLLRYQLYDSARDQVFLTSDIHFLEDFLNLEKIRRDNFDFTITQDGTLGGLEIAPLLIITFVENAVKHSMDAEASSFVHLLFSLKHNELHFHCINSQPRIKVKNNINSGLGLVNVKRRLELIYPGKHQLNINNDHQKFNVHLSINL